jgi:hypothetical protein
MLIERFGGFCFLRMSEYSLAPHAEASDVEDISFSELEIDK